MEFNVHEAKTHFSKLLHRVALGEEIVICKGGIPVAKLVPANPKRQLGIDRGKIWMANDFDGPLPDDILAAFYGEEPDSAEVKKPAARAAAKPSTKKQKKKR